MKKIISIMLLLVCVMFFSCTMNTNHSLLGNESNSKGNPSAISEADKIIAFIIGGEYADAISFYNENVSGNYHSFAGIGMTDMILQKIVR